MSNNSTPLDLDGPTIFWIVWLVSFFVGEWWGRQYGDEMLTHHIWYIRNYATETGASIILFLMYAVLAWINWHFIVEGWQWFMRGSN